MPGAILTFLAVCALVSTYMFVVHSFLRSAEEPDDRRRAEQERRERAAVHETMPPAARPRSFKTAASAEPGS